jgi:phage baseplate assembly protein W
VKTRTGMSSISQSIKNIILTSPGERPFSDIGSDLYSYLFENPKGDELVYITSLIVAAIGKHEPRVVVEYNDVTVTNEGNGKLTINIKYRMANNLESNLVQTLNLTLE